MPLSARVGAACRDALAEIAPGSPVGALLAETVDRLAEPTLRIAVAGRLKAGKSTLVNALLGARLAATDETECTKVVTWFRHGDRVRVRVQPADGSAYDLPPAGGAIPADLGRPAAELASVTLEFPGPAVSRYTVVDTPGLDALSGLDAMSLAALHRCDALIFVMPHPGAQEQQSLQAFRAATSSAGLRLGNAVGVLSQIDRLGTGRGDPWPQARLIAGRYAHHLRASVLDVLPVAGLLAETSGGGRLTDADTAALRAVAAATGRADRIMMLAAADAFHLWQPCPVDADTRRRLMALLGPYGITESLALIDGGVTGTGGLRDELRRRSGLDALHAVITERFLPEADVLRAAGALSALDTALWAQSAADQPAALRTLRARLAQLRADPALRFSALHKLVEDVVTGRTPLPDDAEADLLRLARGRDDAERVGLAAGAAAGRIAGAADERIRRWRMLDASPARSVARCAHAAVEAYEAIYYAARRGVPSGNNGPSPLV